MTIHACMTKSVIGLFESQCVGLTPSNTPPCGVARSAPDVDEALALTVRVTVCSTVAVTEAIFVETVHHKESISNTNGGLLLISNINKNDHV